MMSDLHLRKQLAGWQSLDRIKLKEMSLIILKFFGRELQLEGLRFLVLTENHDVKLEGCPRPLRCQIDAFHRSHKAKRNGLIGMNRETRRSDFPPRTSF